LGVKTSASRVVGLEINMEKSKYMLLSCHQNEGQNHDTKIANRLFENMAQVKYLSLTITTQNFIHEEIKRKLNSGNACYHSTKDLLSSCRLYKNMKYIYIYIYDIYIYIYETIISLVILCRCEIWSVLLREKHGLKVLQNRVLRRIFELWRDEVTGGWRK
jgi:hypothetical protein